MWEVLVLASLLPTPLVYALPGLDSRPANLTCNAPPRPNTGLLELTEPFPDIDIPRFKILTVEYPLGDTSFLYLMNRDGLISRFLNDSTSSTRTEVLNLTSLFPDGGQDGQSGMMDMTFHPSFTSNGELYVAYTVPGNGRTSFVSRHVSTDGGASFSSDGPPLLELAQQGLFHGVGSLFFGQDGLLYISMGDSGNRDEVQNTSTFNGKLLRVDVDGGTPYAIPADNPYAGGGGAREVYALGFRNPWRVTQDRGTGEIWAGDVGMASWEEVNRIEKEGNYGWPIREGGHCNNDLNCDPTGITDPLYEYSHDNGCAVIGGYVYRGALIPSLVGKYLFSDVCTGDISALTVNGEEISVELLLSTGLNVRDFSESPEGEIYILIGSGSRILQLTPVEGGSDPGDAFPTKLSETGCFDLSDPQQVAEGVIPYTVNSGLWSDGASTRRWLAIPDETQITVETGGDWDMPVGTVLIQELSWKDAPFETRFMVRHLDGSWAGHTYEWNAALTDADLVPAAGLSKQIDGELNWDYPSQAQCSDCHSAAAGRSLGLETAQLNGDLLYPGGILSNQLETLESIGMFSNSLGGLPEELPALAAVNDTEAPIDDRARGYLHSNCSICHRPEGSGQGPMDVRFQTAFAATGTCEADPENGDLGVTGAKILTPGDPSRSVMSLRMHATNEARMPGLGAKLVDPDGTAAIDAWINVMASCSGVDTTPPIAPANLVTSTVSDSEINLTWDASTDESGIDFYLIYRDAARLDTTVGTSYRDFGLLAATSYQYSVTALDNVGLESNPSNAITTITAADQTPPATQPEAPPTTRPEAPPTTPPEAPPATPENLQGVVISTSQIDLSWEAASDNTMIDAYLIYRDGIQLDTTTELAYSDQGLTATMSYEYSVTALDNAGQESAPSTVLNLVTNSATVVPQPPSNAGGGAVSAFNLLLLLMALFFLSRHHGRSPQKLRS